jgi:hypothetical protein
MLKQGKINSPRSCQRIRGPFEIERIPKRNCSNNEIEPTGAIALVVKGAISDFSQAVEEDGPSQVNFLPRPY